MSPNKWRECEMNRAGITQSGTTPFRAMLRSHSSPLLPSDRWFLHPSLNNHLKVLRFLCNATVSCWVSRVGTGPVSVLSRVMDQLIISAIPGCFVPGVGARSEYRVTARGIRGIIPAQTSVLPSPGPSQL